MKKGYIVREFKMWEGSLHWVIDTEDCEEWKEFYEWDGATIERVYNYAELHGYEFKDKIKEWE
jgi:hypothetical protein